MRADVLLDGCAAQVQSTWDENLYTTRLDRARAGISAADAQRIADEIEGAGARGRHAGASEERGGGGGGGVGGAGAQEVRGVAWLACMRRLLMLLLRRCVAGLHARRR